MVNGPLGLEMDAAPGYSVKALYQLVEDDLLDGFALDVRDMCGIRKLLEANPEVVVVTIPEAKDRESFEHQAVQVSGGAVARADSVLTCKAEVLILGLDLESDCSCCQVRYVLNAHANLHNKLCTCVEEATISSRSSGVKPS